MCHTCSIPARPRLTSAGTSRLAVSTATNSCRAVSTVSNSSCAAHHMRLAGAPPHVCWAPAWAGDALRGVSRESSDDWLRAAGSDVGAACAQCSDPVAPPGSSEVPVAALVWPGDDKSPSRSRAPARRNTDGDRLQLDSAPRGDSRVTRAPRGVDTDSMRSTILSGRTDSRVCRRQQLKAPRRAALGATSPIAQAIAPPVCLSTGFAFRRLRPHGGAPRRESHHRVSTTDTLAAPADVSRRMNVGKRWVAPHAAPAAHARVACSI